jgi:type VI secretion system protein ImpD
MDAADEIAQHAASVPAVALAGAGAGFFAVKFAWQVPTVPVLISHFDQWQFAKYKTLRGQPYSQFLGLVFGRGLLRPPHGREEVADLEFNYQEPCMTDKDLVWASGAIAGACTVARSIADTGWPTSMAGQFYGKVAGFATATGGAKGEKSFGPTDVQLPETRFGELAAVGLNALTAPRGMADAVFWNGLTVARPRRAEAQAMLEISLSYQLFAIRMSMLLYALKPHLVDMALEKVSGFVTQHVQDWVRVEDRSPPAQVIVQAQPAEDNPTGLDLAVVVTPPARILPGGIPVALGLRVR